jgi:hypothetical protein
MLPHIKIHVNEAITILVTKPTTIQPPPMPIKNKLMATGSILAD